MAAETQTRINLTALKRRDPYIEKILDSATHVAIYTFNPTSGEWVRTIFQRPACSVVFKYFFALLKQVTMLYLHAHNIYLVTYFFFLISKHCNAIGLHKN